MKIRRLAIILYGCLAIPLAFGPPMEIGNDKAAHAVASAVLMVLLWWNLDGEAKRIRVAFAFTLLAGGLVELGQMQVPGRVASLDDLVADGVGAGLVASSLWMARLSASTEHG